MLLRKEGSLGLQSRPVCGLGILCWALFTFLIRLEEGGCRKERNRHRQTALGGHLYSRGFSFSFGFLNNKFLYSNRKVGQMLNILKDHKTNTNDSFSEVHYSLLHLS